MCTTQFGNISGHTNQCTCIARTPFSCCCPKSHFIGFVVFVKIADESNRIVHYDASAATCQSVFADLDPSIFKDGDDNESSEDTTEEDADEDQEKDTAEDTTRDQVDDK